MLKLERICINTDVNHKNQVYSVSVELTLDGSSIKRAIIAKDSISAIKSIILSVFPESFKRAKISYFIKKKGSLLEVAVTIFRRKIVGRGLEEGRDFNIAYAYAMVKAVNDFTSKKTQE